MTFAMFVKYLLMGVSLGHVLETWEDFIAKITVGEERGVSEVRVASLHFSHFALLLIICREMFDWLWGEWRP